MLRARAVEIHMRLIEVCIGTALVEKRASPGGDNRHRVGVARGGFGGLVQLRGRDACRIAVAQDPVAIGV